MKKALITGVTGQDGSYLAELLLSKGYLVIGVQRKTSQFNTSLVEHLFANDRYMGVYGDLLDPSWVANVIYEHRPDEIYNLAAQSHVKISFGQPVYTTQVDTIGNLYFLEALRSTLPEAKFYQASTSELFGGEKGSEPQNETTPMKPKSPYATAKLAAFHNTVNYREGYGLFAANGILFNHEGPRRSQTFVTRKITSAVAEFAVSGSIDLKLGNLYAKRDWGYAREYVEGMWRILQADSPDDFVLATGITYSVKQFAIKAFEAVGEELHWEGEGINEKAYIKRLGSPVLSIDPKFYRPSEVNILQGDATKAKNVLAWEASTQLDELVKIMVEADIKKTKLTRS